MTTEIKSTRDGLVIGTYEEEHEGLTDDLVAGFEQSADAYSTKRNPCSFCGGSPKTMWAGTEKTMFICEVCAIELLPKFYADAVFHPRKKSDDFAQNLVGFASVFWKAIFSRSRAVANTVEGAPSKCEGCGAGFPSKAKMREWNWKKTDGLWLCPGCIASQHGVVDG